jgi:hypothetical protein
MQSSAAGHASAPQTLILASSLHPEPCAVERQQQQQVTASAAAQFASTSPHSPDAALHVLSVAAPSPSAAVFSASPFVAPEILSGEAEMQELAPTPSFHGELPNANQDDVEDACGSDLLEPTEQVIEATDYKSAVRKQAVDAVHRNEVVLLAQKPGFGKTFLMLELCTQERFTMVFVPTKALQKQVNGNKMRTRTHAKSSSFWQNNICMYADY